MKNILILEDDREQASRLHELLSKNIANCNVIVCTDEFDAKEKAGSVDFSLMIIDLVLESGSGLDFAKWVRTVPKYQLVWILIVTGYDSFAIDAIHQAHCFDYILKPYEDNDMLALVDRLLRSKVIRDNNASYLTVLSKGVSFKIKLSDIIFIEINNKNMEIHTANKVYSIKRYSLSRIKEQLPKSMFLQCHRSYIINSERISAVESRGRDMFITMNSHDKPIPVGIRYKDVISSDSMV